MPTIPSPLLAANLDFTQRIDPADLPELMDEPCSYERFRDCVRDIAATTRLTGAYRPTLQFLQEAADRRSDPQTPLRIVDVGSGGGDVLRQVARWGNRRKLTLELTGIDLNPHATRAASEFSATDPLSRSIRWLTGDVFRHPATQAPDLVICSLVTHHMRDEEIVRFLRWMADHARLGWFVSDLVRSARSYRAFRVCSRVMRWHPFVQHDGLVSIRRSFREADWQRLLNAAGIPAEAVCLRRCALGRLCIAHHRSESEGQRPGPLPAPTPT
jgi:2-polyprenyl-3-methyl-5-hydroxy-6-metoxy-1,4-benzoquinol methylase